MRFSLLIPLTDFADVVFGEFGVIDVGASVGVSARLSSFVVSLLGVFLVRAFLQVTGTHTGRVVASVHHILGHVSKHERQRQTMSTFQPFAMLRSKINSSVPVLVSVGSPLPAAGTHVRLGRTSAVHFFPESFA